MCLNLTFAVVQFSAAEKLSPSKPRKKAFISRHWKVWKVPVFIILLYSYTLLSWSTRIITLHNVSGRTRRVGRAKGSGSRAAQRSEGPEASRWTLRGVFVSQTHWRWIRQEREAKLERKMVPRVLVEMQPNETGEVLGKGKRKRTRRQSLFGTFLGLCKFPLRRPLY